MTGFGIFIIVASIVLNAFLLLINQYRKDQLQKESHQVYKLEKDLTKSKKELKQSNEQVEILQALDNALTKEAAHKLAILGKAYDKEKGEGEARELLRKDHARRINPYKTETENYSIDFERMGHNMLQDMDKKPAPRTSTSPTWRAGSVMGGSNNRPAKSRPTTPARSGRGYSPSYDPTPFASPSYSYDDDSSRSSSYSSGSSSYDSGSSSDSGGGGFD